MKLNWKSIYKQSKSPLVIFLCSCDSFFFAHKGCNEHSKRCCEMFLANWTRFSFRSEDLSIINLNFSIFMLNILVLCCKQKILKITSFYLTKNYLHWSFKLKFEEQTSRAICNSFEESLNIIKQLQFITMQI